MTKIHSGADLVTTGVAGLDAILHGGVAGMPEYLGGATDVSAGIRTR